MEIIDLQTLFKNGNSMRVNLLNVFQVVTILCLVSLSIAKADVVRVSNQYTLVSGLPGITSAVTPMTTNLSENRSGIVELFRAPPSSVYTYRVSGPSFWEKVSSFSYQNPANKIIPLNKGSIIRIFKENETIKLLIGSNHLRGELRFREGNWSDLTEGQEFELEGEFEEESSEEDRNIETWYSHPRNFSSQFCYRFTGSSWSQSLIASAKDIPGFLPECTYSDIRIIERIVTSFRIQRTKKSTRLTVEIQFHI